MRPFQTSEPAKTLVAIYPDPGTLRTALLKLAYPEMLGFLRLWVSEGIPSAFSRNPMLYETVRGWLGAELQVHPKEITLIGSARLGYSLCPQPDFGKGFGEQSDLDWSVVSLELFRRFSSDFLRWKKDFESGTVKSSKAVQESYWTSNSAEGPGTIRRGFLHGNRVPRMARYPTSQQIGSAMWRLGEKLPSAVAAPKVKRHTLRVYENWDAFVSLMLINLGHTLRSFQ